MNNLTRLSRDYIRAFHFRDFEAFGSLLAAHFALENPAVMHKLGVCRKENGNAVQAY